LLRFASKGTTSVNRLARGVAGFVPVNFGRITNEQFVDVFLSPRWWPFVREHGRAWRFVGHRRKDIRGAGDGSGLRLPGCNRQVGKI
jgi:hypothetical protein